MQAHEWAILSAGIGFFLLVAELFLPTHGIIGIMGGLFVMVGIGFTFTINAWLGVALFAAALAATPFVFALAMAIFPRTPVGRRVLLPPVTNETPPATVQIGHTGTTVSELRPMGTCEFAGERVEALSDCGIIPAGRRVTVVNMNNRRPTVRLVA